MSEPTDLDPDVDPADVNVQEPKIVGKVEEYLPTTGMITPLIDGRAAYEEMFSKIKNSQKYIYMSSWHLMADTVVKGDGGRATIAGLLKSAADRGVEVRILVAYLMCAKVSLGGVTMTVGFCEARKATSVKSYFESLNSKKIKVVVAVHPRSISYSGNKYYVGCFHEKFMVIDGVYAFCGGLEFASGYTDADSSHKLSDRHDVHSLLEGSIVKQIEAHFVQRWSEEKGSKDSDLPSPASNYDASKNSAALQVIITKYPDQLDVRTAYLTAVGQAKKYIYVENQYFRYSVFTDMLIRQLAHESGLSVIVVLPVKPEEKSDALTDHAVFLQHREIERLRAAAPGRVGVYSLFRSANSSIYVHAKVMIIDDKWATIGSANINQRSFDLDGEIGVILRNDSIATTLRMALWGEHFKIDSSNQARADVANAKHFVTWWDELAAQRDKDILAGKPSTIRVTTHKPPPGKELDLGALGVPWWRQLILPDPDEFTGDFAPNPIG